MTAGGGRSFDLEGWLDREVTSWEGVEARSMFGGRAYLARGRLFAAVTAMGVLLRLPPELHAELLARQRARGPESGAVLPSDQWLAVLPEEWASDRQGMLSLVRRGYEHARSPSPQPPPPREPRRFRKRQY